MKLSEIKTNPNNPRILKDEKFKKLCQSITDFPKMMKLRPIIIDSDNMILGGNMRFKALKELKYKEVPDEWIKSANELTEDEKRRFIVADNVGFGEWDYDLLANEWNSEELEEWGLDLPVYDNINLPSDEQKEPDVFDGFIVVLKINNETFPFVKEKLENICTEYGITIDIS